MYIIMIDLYQPNMQPFNDIARNIVYSGSKQNVKLTMIHGKVLYEDGKFDIGEEPEYIVRRLTPTECARLQGFPDWWCDDLADENPSDEEVAFWTEVFNTHSAIVGKGKPKTEAQVRRFLKEPYSDSAAYKMWGNGIALPNALFVLSGIVYYDQKYDE